MDGAYSLPVISNLSFEKAEDYCVTMQFEMQVAIFLIQRNRHALIGRAIDDNDMDRVLQFLKNDPVCCFWITLLC